MPDNSNYQFRAVPLNLVDYVIKKPKSSREYFRYLLDRTMMMFKYKNLPETIDEHVLERYLQVNGVACITKGPDDKLYCFNGSWGGVQDVYYRPTKFIISNPHISQLGDGATTQFTKECTIYGTQPHDAVLMRNDTEWASLTPLIARYAVLMCENCITVRVADIMLRILALLSAGTDKAYKSAEGYLRKLENGELGVIGDSAFLETLKMQSPPSNNGSYLTQFIELQQYLKGSFFNELGLRANYNMKREAIGAGESTMDADSVLPLCDNMLMCRKEDVAAINSLFGTDITVDYNSAWLENKLETDITFISQLRESGVVTDGSGLGSAGDGSGATGNSTGATGDGMGAVDDPVDVDDVDGNGSSRMEGVEHVEGNEGNSGSKEQNDGNGETDGGDGKVAERAGSEASASGEPGEGRSDGSSDDENGSKVDDGDAGRREDIEDEKNDIKEKIENDEMTLVEAAVDLVNDKISQLVADIKEGGAENV